MVQVKAKAPKEDPETKRRREQAQDRADTARNTATQRDLDSLTEELLRVFGRKGSVINALFSPGSLGGSPTGGGVAAAGGGGAGGGGGVAAGGGSFDPGAFFVDPSALGPDLNNFRVDPFGYG